MGHPATVAVIIWLGWRPWRVFSLSHRVTLDNHISHIKYLKELLNKMNRLLRQIEKERYSEDCEILRSMPGIGRLTALKFRLHWGEMDRFKRLDDLASFMGIVPNLSASGEREKVGKMTKRGRGDMKSALIEASWVAIRKDPELGRRYFRYRQRMNKNKAIIKIAKNLLSRARTLLENRTLYQVNMTG